MPRGVPAAKGPGADQLVELLGNLAKAGASQYFLEIRRRNKNIPGQGNLWQRWKYNIPADDIDDVRQYCYEEGGGDWEYKIWVRDGSGNVVVDDKGKPIGPFYLPAVSAPPPQQSQMPVTDDPELSERIKEIRRRKAELEIERQEAALERERKRLERMKERIAEGDEEEGSVGYVPPWQSPWSVPPQQSPWGPPPPWANPQYQNPQRGDTAVELAKAFAPVLAAVVANRDNGITMKDVVTLLMSEGKAKGFEPKDLIGFVGPLMSEMSRTMGEVNKVAIERMADADQFWKEKLLEAAKLGGAEEDEIEKWRKILGLATDTVREGAKLVFGRPTIAKGDKVEVPVVAKRNVPGLPGPGQGEKQNPPPAPLPTPLQVDPVQKAREVVRERVSVFLLSQEQEMLIGSDPVVVASKLDELYSMLPLSLRSKIETSDTATTYEALREHNAEIVDRILRAVAEDATGNYRAWCETFWDAVKHPDDDEGEDDRGDEPEPQPEPQPDAETAK